MNCFCRYASFAKELYVYIGSVVVAFFLGNKVSEPVNNR